MSKKLVFLLSFCVFLLAPQIVGASVVINEVFYDPSGADTGLEYIMLYNNGDSSYPLTNHCLYASGEHYVFGSFNFGSKEKIIIYWNSDGTNTSADLYTGKDGWSNMGNTSGTVALFSTHESHKSSTIIDFIQYGAEGKTWETTAVSAGIWTAGDFIPDIDEGKAIKLTIDGADNNSSSDWMEATPSISEESEAEEEEEEMPSFAPDGATEDAATDNNLPVARAGDNIIGFVNQEIEFDGTNSSDPDEDELFYSWNMGDGKIIDKPSFTYKYSYPGTYLVTLTVSDGQDYASNTITIKVKPQQITINEFIPNPEGKDEENEWIEIYNDSDSIVDISEWQLDDIASGSKPFIFPENTLIAPKSYIVFSRQITGIALNNDKDSVRLLLPEGMVFQEINYEDPKQGQSSARTDEGFVWSVPTPGMANIVSPPTNMGLGEKEGFVYQQPIESETTKEPSQDYSWYFQSDFDKEIEGGYTFLPTKEQPKADDQFAAISNLAPQAKFNENQKAKQDILNLVLMIIAVILAGLIIGLFLTKLSKKFP